MTPFGELFAGAEKAHGLPAGVLEALAEQESNFYPWASRYEPGFFGTYIGGRQRSALGGFWPTKISETTERHDRATSFGLLQVMGQVARELGCELQSLLELCSPEFGVEYGARHLANKIKKYGSLEEGLSAYNAGRPIQSNRVKYVQPILARMGRA